MNIRKAIGQKEFKFKMDNVEETIILRPLKGEHLALLFRVLHKLEPVIGGKDKEQIPISELLHSLDEQTVSDMVVMCRATVSRSIPDASPEDVEDFVSQYMFQLINPIMELNLNVK